MDTSTMAPARAVRRQSAAGTVPVVRTKARARRGAAVSQALLAALVGLTPLLLGLVLWQVVAPVDSFTFPRPDAWWSAARDMQAQGLLVAAVQQTMRTLVLGLLLSIVAGAALGWLIGSSPKVERALSPLLDFFRSMPTPALVPVATVLLGVTTTTGVAIIVIGVVWPILLNTASARRSLPAVRLETARVLGLSRWARLTRIVFPSLVPDLMTGIRTAVSTAFVVALVVDILGSGEGIGRLLLIKQQTFDSAAVWAILVIVGLLGVIINGLAVAVENRVRRAM